MLVITLDDFARHADQHRGDRAAVLGAVIDAGEHDDRRRSDRRRTSAAFRSRAIAAAGPMPGRTPSLSWPRCTPRKQKSTLFGVARSRSRRGGRWTRPSPEFPRPERHRHGEPVLEDERRRRRRRRRHQRRTDQRQLLHRHRGTASAGRAAPRSRGNRRRRRRRSGRRGSAAISAAARAHRPGRGRGRAHHRHRRRKREQQDTEDERQEAGVEGEAAQEGQFQRADGPEGRPPAR